MPSASGAQGPSSLGLNLLTQVEEKGPTRTGLDVVAVHGINGDAFKTWKVENGGPSWLQDFLPQDLPGARIFSFGYESHVLFSKSHGDLSTFAHILLAQLVAAREGKLRSRPLVFLCHSMGGLVVKQASDRKIHTPQSGPLSSSCELRANAVKALIQARLDEREYPGIRDSTKAIIFLSTPHRGSNAAVWPLFLSNIVNTCTYVGRGVGGRVNGELIKAVKSGSDGLSALSRNFRNQTDGVRIVSCYEQNATTPLFDLVRYPEGESGPSPPPSRPWFAAAKMSDIKVVDEHTGVLGFPGEKIIPMMGCDHRTVCRFTSKDDWNYKLIVREIKEATGSAGGFSRSLVDLLVIRSLTTENSFFGFRTPAWFPFPETFLRQQWAELPPLLSHVRAALSPGKSTELTRQEG